MQLLYAFFVRAADNILVRLRFKVQQFEGLDVFLAHSVEFNQVCQRAWGELAASCTTSETGRASKVDSVWVLGAETAQV